MAKKLAFDKVLFTAVVLLVCFGLVMVYSASAAVARESALGLNSFLVKQGVAAALGLVLMLWLMYLDYRVLREPAVVYSLFGAVLLLLIAVLFAPELNNTRRWFHFAGMSIQLNRPYKVGDWLKIGDTYGEVREINWRSTRVCTNDDIYLDIPNNEIVRSI